MRWSLLALACTATGGCGDGTLAAPAGATGGAGGGPGATSSAASATGASGSVSCTADADCTETLSCCDGACVDLATDLAHCGACNATCTPFSHAATICADGGRCAMGDCFGGFVDCNGETADGCESAPTDCVCAPETVEPCYEASAGEGVGPCKAGTRTCDATGLGWGSCIGQVLPVLVDESCDGIDDDCDGMVDPEDADFDGWTVCDGDCCDSLNDCAKPHDANPGAFEWLGNGVDDDCDPVSDDLVAVACEPIALDVPTTAMELAQAMDLCQWTAEAPPLPDRKWGVISAELLLADGSQGPPADVQVGALAVYGDFVTPTKSATMAALSSGTARSEGDVGHVHPQDGPQPGQSGGFDAGTIAAVPAKYVAPYGGALPPSADCPWCMAPSCGEARDSVNLKLRIRVPTNAWNFELDYKRYTAECPERACAGDHFLALLTTGLVVCNGMRNVCVPSDANVAIDFFNDYKLSTLDCSQLTEGAPGLIGTGMGGWNGALNDGAAAAWETMTPWVIPGETIELELVIWDGTDHEYDSLVLLDGFRWK